MNIAISVFNLLASAAQVFAIIYLISQLKLMRVSNTSTALRDVYDILQSDEIRKARSHVFNVLGSKPYEKWDNDTDKYKASQVCQSYDFVGNMVKIGLIPEKIIADSWGASLRRCEPILRQYIDELRIINDAEEIWDDFDLLCKAALKYQKKIPKKDIKGK